jgi:hypothetical protein
MMATLRGIYRAGVVHLREPLALPDNTEVDVSVSPVETQEHKQSERDRIHALFVAKGLVRPHAHPQAQPPLSPEREAEIAEKLAKAGSLSELIIKERDL